MYQWTGLFGSGDTSDVQECHDRPRPARIPSDLVSRTVPADATSASLGAMSLDVSAQLETGVVAAVIPEVRMFRDPANILQGLDE
jgi:hypothetical protein